MSQYSNQGEQGQPGEPGEPGTLGGGTGGKGGSGGRGGSGYGRGPLLGYVFLVAISVFASIGYSRHNDKVNRAESLKIEAALSRSDRISCEQRIVLAKNQTDVLGALIFDRVQHKTLETQIQPLRDDLVTLQLVIAKGC